MRGHLTDKQISKYSTLLTPDQKEIKEIIANLAIPDYLKKILNKKIINILHHKQKNHQEELMTFIDDNSADIFQLLEHKDLDFLKKIYKYNVDQALEETISEKEFIPLEQPITFDMYLNGCKNKEDFEALKGKKIFKNIVKTDTNLVSFLGLIKNSYKKLLLSEQYFEFLHNSRISFSILKKIMKNNSLSELKNKFDTIIEYRKKESQKKGEGIIIEGSAVGFAIQSGTSEELKNKFDIIIEYRKKESQKKGEGIILNGQALGLAIQYGTSEELKNKFDIIIEYRKKEFQKKGEGIIIEGIAVGFAIQSGTSEELKNKLETLYKQEIEFVKILDSKNLNEEYYKDIFIKNFKRVFLYNYHNLRHKKLDETKIIINLQALKAFDFETFESTIIEYTQDKNSHTNLRKELDSNFGGKFEAIFLECIISYFTGNIYVSMKNKATLVKVFTGGEKGHGNTVSLSQGKGEQRNGVINIDLLEGNLSNPELEHENEEDTQQMIKWFLAKDHILSDEDAQNYLNIIRQMNPEKDIIEMLESALRNLKNIDALITALSQY